MHKPHHIAVFALLLSVAAGTLACHHFVPEEPRPSNVGRARKLARPGASADSNGTGVPPGVAAHLIASVPEHTVGPLLARGAAGTMAAYLGAAPEGGRRIVAIPLRTDGSPLPGHVVATAGPDSTTFVLGPTGGGGEGFVAAWTDLTDRGEALSVAGIAKDGGTAVAAVEVARTNNDIVWVEIVPTSRGSICVWAEQTRNGGANVLALALDPTGKPRGVASRIIQDVLGWQAMPTTAGVALALVVATSTPAGRVAEPHKAPPPAGVRVSAPQPSSVTLLKLDADARPVAPPVTVASASFAIADADAARAAGGYVFAWTDRTGTDPVVMTAFVDGEGKTSPPHIVTNGSGGATMTALAGQTDSALLAWEESSKRSKSQRRLHFTRLDAGGVPRAGSETVLEVDASAAPELIASGTGFALLARARACTEPPPAADPLCDAAPLVPTVVRLAADLTVRSTEPLLLSDKIDAIDKIERTDPAQIAWGLGCDQDRCSVLAASGEAPVRVSTIDLSPRPNRYRAPVPQRLPAGAPQLETVQTITSGADLADLAAVTLRDGRTMLATLTSALDEPAKKGGPAVNPGAAVVALRIMGSDGRPEGAPVTITRRALAVGGVAISAGGKPEDGAALAWVDRDDGDLEVHVAHVDPNGKSLKDVRLTMSRGDASDVAIAWADGGWLLAWVDTRDGNGEVYTAKVGLDLQRLARDERITNAPGDASDVTLLADEGSAWLAWADPRESPHDGFADIFVTRLRGKDAMPDVRESRVLPTATHSRSPSLARGEGGGVVVAWIEEAPMGVDATSNGAYGAMIAWLDEKGHPTADPVRSKGAGEGSPTSIVLDRSSGTLHALIARSAREEVAIDTLTPRREAAGAAYALLGLDGPPSLDVAMALLGDSLYFNDDGPEAGEGRARRAKLIWTQPR